jgi:hypothetical protein
MKRLSIALLVLLSAYINIGAADKPDVDSELWEHLQRRSTVWYQKYLQSNGVVDPGDWKGPIEATFQRLAGASGKPGFSMQYSVINNQTFNAAAFPGGQFIIHIGALRIFDSIIQREAGSAQIDPVTLSGLREKKLAPVIAHELGHYYNRHTFNSIKKIWNMSSSKKNDNIELSMIKYSQENELDADRTGYLLLQQAGYDPGTMITLLEFLNLMQQDQLKRVKDADNRFNAYLTTHPSAHKRLAELTGDPNSLHSWAATIEQAFSDVQVGKNLNAATKVIEDALAKYPGNIHLMKAHATAIHKQWLASVPVSDQKLRPIIDMPAFRDDMVLLEARGTRSAKKKIPGDRKLYEAAKKAYETISSLDYDPGFSSNFGLLLCYSDKEEERNNGLSLASVAAQKESTIPIVTNLATALYISGQTEKAIGILSGLAKEFDSQYSKFLEKASTDRGVMGHLQMLRDHMKKYQMIDREYVFSNFTPILNLSLALKYEGKLKESKEFAAIYFAKYETGSAWAKYLSKISGVRIAPPEKKSYMAVKGLKVGDTLEVVLKKWGKADFVSKDVSGNEFWLYKKFEVRLYIDGGTVMGIELISDKSPKVENRFGIGSKKEDIEKITGPYKRVMNMIFVYEGKQNIAIQYQDNMARVIMLFP